MREFVTLVNAGVDANDTMSLSNYGFLYGTFPVAPGVFVYANHYDVAVQLVLGRHYLSVLGYNSPNAKVKFYVL